MIQLTGHTHLITQSGRLLSSIVYRLVSSDSRFVSERKLDDCSNCFPSAICTDSQPRPDSNWPCFPDKVELPSQAILLSVPIDSPGGSSEIL